MKIGKHKVQRWINVSFSFFVLVFATSCEPANTSSQALPPAPLDSSVPPGTDTQTDFVSSSQIYVSNKTEHSVIVRSGSMFQKLNPNECLVVGTSQKAGLNLWIRSTDISVPICDNSKASLAAKKCTVDSSQYLEVLISGGIYNVKKASPQTLIPANCKKF